MNCRKGVTYQNTGYYCSKCNISSISFVPWLIGNFKMADHTSSFFVNCAGESDCLAIFGVDEKTLYEKMEGEEEVFHDFCFDKLF